jgi:hypothetical protein
MSESGVERRDKEEASTISHSQCASQNGFADPNEQTFSGNLLKARVWKHSEIMRCKKHRKIPTQLSNLFAKFQARQHCGFGGRDDLEASSNVSSSSTAIADYTGNSILMADEAEK